MLLSRIVQSSAASIPIADLFKAIGTGKKVSQQPYMVLTGYPPRWHKFDPAKHAGHAGPVLHLKTQADAVVKLAATMGHDTFHAMPHDEQMAAINQQAEKIQAGMSAAAAVSMFKQSVISGKVPSPAQAKAFDALPYEKQFELGKLMLAQQPKAPELIGAAWNLLHGHETFDVPAQPEPVAAPVPVAAPAPPPVAQKPSPKQVVAAAETVPPAAAAPSFDGGPSESPSTYNHTTDGHNKFWTVTVQGAVLITHHGAIGSKGAVSKKQMASHAAAVAARAKLVAEKMGKGYHKAATQALPASAMTPPRAAGPVFGAALSGYIKAVSAGQRPTSVQQIAYADAWENDNPKAIAVLQALKVAGVDEGAVVDAAMAATDHAKAKKAEPAAAGASLGAADDWLQTGPQKGSNPGGRFKAPDGTEWYCKFPATEDHVKNEILAAELYKAAGIKVPELRTVTKDGKVGVASRWVDGVAKASPAQLSGAAGSFDGFAVDAWLANWDAVGLATDNLLLDKSGAAIRIDVGGALLFRAQGSPKGAAFGNDVGELDSLRGKSLDPSKNNAQAAAVFGGMTNAEVAHSIYNVVTVSHSTIKAACLKHGPGSEADRKALASKLIARQKSISAWLEKNAPAPAAPPKVVAAAEVGPKDGDTKPAAGGGTLVFKDGHWHEQPGSAPPVLSASEKAPAKPQQKEIDAQAISAAHDSLADALLPASNTNAGPVNKKLGAIQAALASHDLSALQAMTFGSNTYGKKAEKLAQQAIAALGGGGSATAAAPAAPAAAPAPPKVTAAKQKPVAAKKRLDESALPVQVTDLPPVHDFLNWKGPGSGLSSSASVNKANLADEKALLAFAATGNLVALKAYKYKVIDKETGAAIGFKPIESHPSAHVKAYHSDLVAYLEAIAHPPKPLSVVDAKAGSIDELAKSAGFEKLGLTSSKVTGEKRLGFFIGLSKATSPKKFVPAKSMHVSDGAKFAATGKHKSLSKLARHFISRVQSSGTYNNVFRDGKAFDADGNKAADVAAACYADAGEMPEGTTIYRWMHMPDAMVKQIMAADDGLVFQNPGSMCCSMSPTATKGFGEHRLVIRYAKGAKAMNSFASGGYSSEQEITALMGQRFMIIGKSKVQGKGGAGSSRLELELLMLPPDPGYVADLKAQAAATMAKSLRAVVSARELEPA